MVDDEAEIEIINTPPSARTQEDWDKVTCWVCYGCPECEHTCYRTDEERAPRIWHHDEAVEAAIAKGPGRHQLSDGSWVTVLRGPSDPDSPSGDGLDAEPPRFANCRSRLTYPTSNPTTGGGQRVGRIPSHFDGQSSDQSQTLVRAAPSGVPLTISSHSPDSFLLTSPGVADNCWSRSEKRARRTKRRGR
jgi:hypothetical protein